ncbi:MAG: DUF1207 domain-containing protein, partial [Gammaproteobacteria bacterium]|nr:DUF1207 domain-containing protein [Gammaproteobacteria bacterium]
MNVHRKLRRPFLLPLFLYYSFLFLSVSPAPLWAEDPGAYMRGYVQALLDSRFPGLGLYVKTVEPANQHVKLSSRTCLGPSQKRNIEHLLIQTEHVKVVAWDASANCDKPETAPSSKTTEESVPLPFEIRVLPEEELFATLLADPRQPRFSVSYQHYASASKEFAAAGVAYGEYFGLASGFFGEAGSSQVGIQGAIFALFNLDAPSSDLVNADYWIGLPISYRKGPWSYLLRLYHQSSHLGD